MASSEPNEGHRLLLELEKKFDRFLIATQNVDGLHQAAGSTRVTELHGNVWQVARPRTTDYTEDERFSWDSIRVNDPEYREEILERWSRENNCSIWEDHEVPFRCIPPYPDPAVRPNVLFMDEPYGNRLLWVEDFINRGVDQILIIGCSGAVGIVCRLVRQAKSSNHQLLTTCINPGDHEIDGVDRHIRKDAIAGLSTALIF